MNWLSAVLPGKTSSEWVQKRLPEIRQSASKMEQATDTELRQETERLREAVESGQSPTAHQSLVPAFALMNEAIRRTLGYTYYDVQLLAGWELARGNIAEMQTGEGKTLVAGLPAFVHALTGKGMHIATANHYLAARDCEELRPAFELLGMTASLLPERVAASQKQPVYQCDITYGTGYEFGFDYLRDQLSLRQREKSRLGESLLKQLSGEELDQEFLQHGHAFAVIDEIDSVLIDDANSPLVLSESSNETAEDTAAHQLAYGLLSELEHERDYWIKPGSIEFSDEGLKAIHADTVAIPYSVLKRPWAEYVRQALRAKYLFQRDAHYLVREGKVNIVDQNTGRIFEDRHWRDGLHQAVEAKEGLTITAEKLPLAQITRQRFFQRYEILCGMTGTATGSETEFRKFYRLAVKPIPLRKPSRRQVLPSRYFADAHAKWNAVADAVRERQRVGQPVLVGTRTISASQILSDLLTEKGISHVVLNGCQDAEEAGIVATAGHVGQVTIATNMAGRGTDIKPNPEAMALGGLHVIGTERHDSSRVDRQLIGRSARQGDPGSAQFFLSADDELIAAHHSRLHRLMRKSADSSGEVHLALDKTIRRLQQHQERARYQERVALFRFDEHRESVLERLHGS